MAKSILERFESKIFPCPMTGCWLWTGAPSGSGYGEFHIIGRGKTTAHRRAWEIYIGPVPKGLIVCHHCDVRLCVNPKHLFLGTTLDNARDKMSKGRGADKRGIKHHLAKLTENQILEIRNSKESQNALAAKFNVSQGHISEIRSRKMWPHI